MRAIFSIQKLGTDSANFADSENIKILIQFPGNSILTLCFLQYRKNPGIEPTDKDKVNLK